MKIPIEFLVNTIKMVDFPLEKFSMAMLVYRSVIITLHCTIVHVKLLALVYVLLVDTPRQGPGLGVLYKNHESPKPPERRRVPCWERWLW